MIGGRGLMVAAVGVDVIFAYLRKRVMDRQREDAAVTRAWLVANTMFYGPLFVAIQLLWNWFNLLSPRFTSIRDETVSLVWLLLTAAPYQHSVMVRQASGLW